MRELFALFSSPTDDELRQVFDPSHINFYKRENLDAEYSLTQEKREFADDAWRAVTYFLHRKGFKLCRNGIVVQLKWLEVEREPVEFVNRVWHIRSAVHDCAERRISRT